MQFEDSAALNVPLSQLVQVLAAGPLKVPIVQHSHDAAAAPEYLPDGHAEHTVARPLLK